MRTFNWVCNLFLFVAMCCIILFEAYAAVAFATYLLVAVIQTIVNGASKVWWKGFYAGYNFEDNYQYEEDVRQRVCTCLGTLRQRFWRQQRVLFRRTAADKVQPVLDGSEASSSSSETTTSSSSSSSSDDDDDDDDDDNAVSSSDIDSDGAGAENGLYDDQESDDEYLPHQRNEIDPFILSRVKDMLKTRVRKEHMKDASRILSKVACRGQISVSTCAEALARHIKDHIGLRHRATDLSEDLDRLCKSAERRRIKRALVNDIIHASHFDRETAPNSAREKSWRGTDAFRHVLEKEVTIPRGKFDALLHSVLTIHVRSPE